MPYVSNSQRRFAHTDTAKKKGFPTEEFDEKSRGMKLPERAGKSKSKVKGKKRPVNFGKPFGKSDDKY